jgi:tetratricopeptide (TPR) repeat protein
MGERNTVVSACEGLVKPRTGATGRWRSACSAARASESTSAPDRAKALGRAGAIHREVDQLDDAISASKRARVLCHADHDRRAEVDTIRSLAEAYHERGAFDEAAMSYQAAARLAGSLHDRPAEARLLRDLGETYLAGDRPEEAAPVLERSLRLHRVVGDDRGRPAPCPPTWCGWGTTLTASRGRRPGSPGRTTTSSSTAPSATSSASTPVRWPTCAASAGRWPPPPDSQRSPDQFVHGVGDGRCS